MSCNWIVGDWALDEFWEYDTDYGICSNPDCGKALFNGEAVWMRWKDSYVGYEYACLSHGKPYSILRTAPQDISERKEQVTYVHVNRFDVYDSISSLAERFGIHKDFTRETDYQRFLHDMADGITKQLQEAK